MADKERSTNRYQFASSIELPRVLSALEIECLDVSPERALAIYRRSVLNIVVVDGCLSDARTVDIEVLDQPPDAPEEPCTLIETMVKRLGTAVESTGRDLATGAGTNVS